MARLRGSNPYLLFWRQTFCQLNYHRILRIGFFVLPRISIPCPYRGYLLQYDNNDPKHLRSMSVSPNSEKRIGGFIYTDVAPTLVGYLEILRSNWRQTQDSNLQAFYSQRFSRPLPHHPDICHIYKNNIAQTPDSPTGTYLNLRPCYRNVIGLT